jgi:hypothetical protein
MFDLACPHGNTRYGWGPDRQSNSCPHSVQTFIKETGRGWQGIGTKGILR